MLEWSPSASMWLSSCVQIVLSLSQWSTHQVQWGLAVAVKYKNDVTQKPASGGFGRDDVLVEFVECLKDLGKAKKQNPG